MSYDELNTMGLYEVDSVSSFIGKVKELRDSFEGTSTELYFRGQETEFWDVEPSVFRNNMLSIEHKLMQIPLQKIPMEFKEFNSMFDVMTKYQHYGMCTRLLDLTTNPLVALYFACKSHGNEEYNATDGDNTIHEPYGVVYFTNNYYPSKSNDKEVQIVSALASYDLSKNNTIAEVLERLRDDKTIDDKTYKTWLDKAHIKEFINIIQNNYMVMPTYTNERLRKQSGVFLLASSFSVDKGTDTTKSVISKSKANLRDGFAETYFYIRGENKEDILKELDLYNINEATLFPELEHQLSYIRYINGEYVQSVGDFTKYEEDDIKQQRENICIDDDKLNRYILDNLTEILKDTVDPDEINELKGILDTNLTVDWYKRDQAISKIRLSLTGYYYVKSKDKVQSKEKAVQITNKLCDVIKNFTASQMESGE